MVPSFRGKGWAELREGRKREPGSQGEARRETEREGETGVWLGRADDTTNRNDFGVSLVWHYLHLCSPPSILTFRPDEIRPELESGEAGEGHISCPSREAPWAHGSPGTWFLAGPSP